MIIVGTTGAATENAKSIAITKVATTTATDTTGIVTTAGGIVTIAGTERLAQSLY